LDSKFGPWELAVLAVALAVDAFSVAAASAPSCSKRWGALRLAGAFGFFQALMPVLGALAGCYLLEHVRAYDHWVAFGLLEIIGLKMLADALWLNRRGKKDGEAAGAPKGDPSWGWSLLGLSIATSIDAFGAGVAIQVQGANLWLAAPVIGVTCAGLTYLGARLGHAAERWFGSKAEVAGGAVLMALGVKMLFSV
jgi:putative Mn2+ efflux pump MntP